MASATRGAGLEARGRLDVGRLVAADALDHVPAAEPRRHRLEQLAAAVQDADAGRAVGLVAGPGVEVDAERGDVDRQVRDGLRAVDDDDRAGGVRAARDLLDRVDGREDVQHVGDGEQLRPVRQHLVERVEVEPPVVGDADVVERRPALRASICHGTMLEWCSISVSAITSPSPTLRGPTTRRRG